ncbi:MAG TPA: TIGR03667 family PPOX class F420-dependent oxidoreductase [Candidatus Binatia bacterium]|jgi:PPOX class probable F420-dependent enzyme|nr:TIGR03667 family PPOX class F420-dependent oxidoreductase [Candidatus Binatia bacterium]
MLDFSTKLGRHVKRRLAHEKVIWLTTVDADNAPQPRPVWFHWNGKTFLIFSQSGKAKLRHIERNANVSLNFNTDSDGGDVAVFAPGRARILDAPPDPVRVEEYLKKYRDGIKELGMTIIDFTESYSVPLEVAPQALRGYVE